MAVRDSSFFAGFDLAFVDFESLDGSDTLGVSARPRACLSLSVTKLLMKLVSEGDALKFSTH